VAIHLRSCHTKHLLALVGIGHIILRNSNYGNEMEELALNMKLEMFLCELSTSSKSTLERQYGLTS
jgi:hypothetical protein